MRIVMSDYNLIRFGKRRFTRRLSSNQFVDGDAFYSKAGIKTLYPGQVCQVSSHRNEGVVYVDSHGEFISDIRQVARVAGYMNSKAYAKLSGYVPLRVRVQRVDYVRDVRLEDSEFFALEALCGEEFLARWLYTYCSNAYSDILSRVDSRHYVGDLGLDAVAYQLSVDDECMDYVNGLYAGYFEAYSVLFDIEE